MAFSNTATDTIFLANGLIQEYGTWSGAGVTTGVITAATSGTFESGAEIMDIIQWGFASNGDAAVIPAKDTGYANSIKITFTSADAGNYWIVGKAV